MDLTLVRPVTKADAAYVEMRSRIVDATLAPGSRLDQELLAATLGVSTTPLREALRRLEAEHLVHRAAHRQVVIAPLSRTELHELYVARIELDALAVVLAATAVQREEVDAMHRLLDSPPAEHPRDHLRADRAFHRALYRAAHNEVVIEILDSLWDRSDRYRYFLLANQPGVAGTASHEHGKLVALVAAGDGSAAAALMRQHLGDSAARIDGLLRGHRAAFSP